MPRHGNRQQKKLAKKKAKRADKRSFLARRAHSGIELILRQAGEWPILEAMIPSNLWDQGMGQPIIARQMPDGRIAFAVFLLDTYCLGVKDAFYNILTPFQYRDFFDKLESVGSQEPISPESFAKLIDESVMYARSIGFEPHPDYNIARLLLAGIDPSLSSEQFEFGKDGKPFYVQGPNDSPGKATAIMAKVQAMGGHYMMVLDELPEGYEIVEDEVEAIDGDVDDNSRQRP